MSEELHERLLPAIKNRKDVDSKRVSVWGLFQVSNMETWYNVCCSRIIDEANEKAFDTGEIEGSMSDTWDYQMQLTSNGLLEYKEILLGYIPENVLEFAFEIACMDEQLTSQVNYLAQTLRNTKTRELIKYIFKAAIWHKETCHNEYFEDVRHYYILELFYRSHLWQAVRKLHGAVADGYQRIKYRRIISELAKVGAAHQE